VSKRVELSKEELVKAIDEAKSRSKRRRFTQSVELIIAIEGLDLKRPENRISGVVRLPNEPNKKKSVAVFADGPLAEKAREAGADAVITGKDLDSLAGSKRECKKLAKRYDFFLAEPSMMAKVGRVLGFALGPRGKMPQILPPSADVKIAIDNLRSSARIHVRNNPMVALAIGDEEMDSEKLAENAMAVIRFVEGKVAEKDARISRIYVKTTMGPAVRVL